ncbi:MAG TPA: hypothetical protein VLK55_09065 [Kocuria rosea]|nr:hypothetical protein [Kocuria rosea]
MTQRRTPARWALPAVLALLLGSGAAGGWWLEAGRPVPADELARADAWRRTEALLGAPSLAALDAEQQAAVREDLRRQLEALAPAPGDRAAAAAREQRPGAPAGPAPEVLAASARTLADDALAVADPALARVLAAAAASRATTARQLAGRPAAPPPSGALCAPDESTADEKSTADEGATDGGATDRGRPAAGTVLWSALDRAGYAFEALSARAELAPAGSPSAAALDDAAARTRRLLAGPVARGVLAAEPGLPAGAYVLPDGAAEHPGAAAATAAADVQAAAAHVLGHAGAGTRCWALAALEQAGGVRAGLTGEVDALPGIAGDGAGP